MESIRLPARNTKHVSFGGRRENKARCIRTKRKRQRGIGRLSGKQVSIALRTNVHYRASKMYGEGRGGGGNRCSRSFSLRRSRIPICFFILACRQRLLLLKHQSNRTPKKRTAYSFASLTKPAPSAFNRMIHSLRMALCSASEFFLTSHQKTQTPEQFLIRP